MENNEIKYIVYLTMNMINGKYYIGVHKTETPWKFDNYLGCGAKISEPSSYNKGKYPLHAAILKYGINQFHRITLKVCDTLEEALELEKYLVTKEFIQQPCNYNATVGGGTPPLLTKPINQFDLKGNFIKTWNSETEIKKFFKSKVNLSDIIKDKRNFAGYYWTFDNIKSININDYKKIVSHSFIDQYDLNGNFIRSYKTSTLASQMLDIDYKKINQAVFKQKPCEGYYFLKSGVNIDSIFCKNLKRTANKHPIFRYLETGELDKAYPTIVSAIRDTKNTSESKLRSAVLNGHIYANYRWSFIKCDNYFDIINPTQYNKVPPIEQYDKDGNLIKIWEDPKECKKHFPYCYRVCRGDLKSTAGYVFKYKN